ncbi:hypothetical protein ACTFIY_005054 [Dictyostelium cf. discoideum]
MFKNLCSSIFDELLNAYDLKGNKNLKLCCDNFVVVVVFDVGVGVDGDQLVIMKSYFSFLRILSELSNFCKISRVEKNHHSIIYCEININYYLKILLKSLNFGIKIFDQIENHKFANYHWKYTIQYH